VQRQGPHIPDPGIVSNHTSPVLQGTCRHETWVDTMNAIESKVRMAGSSGSRGIGTSADDGEQCAVCSRAPAVVCCILIDYSMLNVGCIVAWMRQASLRW
jgi:hypothetical protein